MALPLDLPVAEDRRRFDELLLRGHEAQQSIAASFWTNLDLLSTWFTSCDREMLVDPPSFYRVRLAEIARMHRDASDFIAKVIPALDAETDGDARLLGRLVSVARWTTRLCETVTLLLEAHEMLVSRPPDAQPLRFSSRGMERQDIRERYAELANTAWDAAVRPENYVFDSVRGRNSMRLDQLGFAMDCHEGITDELTRLRGIHRVYFPDAPNTAESALFFDPPLTQFELLGLACEWICALASRDLHARLIAGQEAILAALKTRLAELRTVFPTLRTISAEQRKAFFAQLDQLHFDASELRYSVERDLYHPAVARAGRDSGAATKGVGCFGRGSSSGLGQGRSMLSMLLCSAENTSEPDEGIPHREGASLARAKILHNAAIAKHIVDETSALRSYMDKVFAAEYTSGIGARASRAVDALVRWAQSYTVVFDA